MCIKINGICQISDESEFQEKMDEHKDEPPRNFREGHLDEEWGE